MTENPIILEENSTVKSLAKLKDFYKPIHIYDIYLEQLKELFEITFPNLINNKNYSSQLKIFLKTKFKDKVRTSGVWVYFPWNGKLIHTVKKEDLYELRTNRNRNLITKIEQEKLKKFCIGIVGLSVGSNLASNLIYQGLSSDQLKLAEFDILETTNLNRIKAGISDIGRKKIDVLAQQIYEIDPYITLNLYPEGLNEKTLTHFIGSNKKPDLIFEVIDNFEMKIKLRLLAKQSRIPVVMMANLGDSILVDIERYDLNPNLQLFNGLLGDLTENILKNPNGDINKYAIQIVGLENIPKRAVESVSEINKTLVGRPQLSSTVTIAGGLATYIARKIALKETVWSGRKKFPIDSFFDEN